MNTLQAPVIISTLDEAHLPSYKSLRLRALKDHPDAFLETPESFAARSDESINERMRESQARGGFTLVAEVSGRGLVGTASLAVGSTPKDSHRGLVWGVYVAPEARGLGIGQLLLRELIDRSAHNSTLRNLHLAVVQSNDRARRLYTSLGFRKYGLDLDALYVNGEFLSEVLMARNLRSTEV
jgi:ribosomal protein S18 acetylase RimI-like enzyme